MTEMRWTKHQGDGLKKLGIDTEGLNISNKRNMENILFGIGVNFPLPSYSNNEVLTPEEIQILTKEWKDYQSRERDSE